MMDVPLLPLVAAVMVTGEVAAMSVTSPVGLTVTAAGLLLVQVKVWPARVLPAASLATPASCAVPPTPTVAVAGETVTEATVAATLPDRLKLHRVIEPLPVYAP